MKKCQWSGTGYMGDLDGGIEKRAALREALWVYNKNAIIQATTIKNIAAIPRQPDDFLLGGE